MAVTKIRTLFLNNMDMLDEEMVAAARLLEREGVVDGVVQIAPDAERPKGLALIVPQEKMKLMPVLNALFKIAEETGLLFREEGEIPSVSPEYAASRGFSEEEITTHLRPWVAERAKAIAKNIAETKKAYDEAVLAGVAAYNDEFVNKGGLVDEIKKDHPTAVPSLGTSYTEDSAPKP